MRWKNIVVKEQYLSIRSILNPAREIISCGGFLGEVSVQEGTLVNM